MNTESRTSKSIINAGVNAFFFVAQTIVGFWARKVFYDYLGSEVLGLDTTAASLLQLLNIAESGIGAAVAYFLYKPFYNHDTESINDIVSIQGYLYRRIATGILALSCGLMFFFPKIFHDIKVPLWYAYATFSTLLIGNLLGYYVNYRQSVLSADQKTYKVVKVTQLSSILLRVFLIIYLPYSKNPFILYLGTTLAGYIIGSAWLNHVLKKEYPWLAKAKLKGRELLRKYPEVITKTKQLFLHKIAGFVVYYASPLIMYSFSTLTTIAYYGNYLAITDKAKIMMSQVFSSTGASVGNLIASGDQNRMKSIFWELTDSKLCFSTIMIFILYFITEPFISVWLSSEYLLGKGLLFLVLLNSWLFINRSTIDNFKDGFGIFQDVWAPFAESIINASVAIFCGFLFGIKGVLLGTTVSYILIIYIWKPYCLFKVGFKTDSVHNFFVPYIKRIAGIAVLALVLFKIVSLIQIEVTNFGNFCVYALVVTLIASIFFYVALSLIFPGMKSFNRRIFRLVRK